MEVRAASSNDIYTTKTYGNQQFGRYVRRMHYDEFSRYSVTEEYHYLFDQENLEIHAFESEK